MVFVVDKHTERSKCTYDEAVDRTGFGKYNISMLLSCCLLILAMYQDIFGLSVVLPAVACDMNLSTSQQGFMSAVPLIGVMLSSYAWGLCADTRGRRWTLLAAMPIGAILNITTSMAPTYASLVSLKFISACFTSSANAAGFVLASESAPKHLRSRFMFLMASATMFVQFFICIFALPILQLTFRIPITWLSFELRPWRVLLLVISMPGVIGCVSMMFLRESPKYLLSKGRDEEAMEVLKTMFNWNTGLERNDYSVKAICLEVSPPPSDGFARKMWNQTAPLFKPPLLKNSVKLYYILLCAYMTSTGYTMWVPTMTNAYFNGFDASGKTFCEVASTIASSSNNSTLNCDEAIKMTTLYAVMGYSCVAGFMTILISFLVGTFGKRRITLFIFSISALSGFSLLFARIPMLSLVLFTLFLYVAFILGNMNTYLVELNPTHLRGMATCLSVVVARGFGFISVQLIASLLAHHCVPMVAGYVVLVISGLVVSIFLPPDEDKHKNDTSSRNVEVNCEKTKL